MVMCIEFKKTLGFDFEDFKNFIPLFKHQNLIE